MFEEAGLLKTSQVTEALGVSRQYISNLKRTYSDFPQPVARFGKCFYWSKDSVGEIQTWIEENLKRPFPGTPLQRVFSEVRWADKWFTRDAVSTRCLEWTGPRRRGYGFIYYRGHTTGVYRVVYEELFGPIPKRDSEGNRMEVDHLCRNRACVNPTHLEVVPSAVNTQRSQNANILASQRNRCVRDLHDLTPENVLLSKSGGRGCRECTNARRRRRRAERKTLRQNSGATVFVTRSCEPT